MKKDLLLFLIFILVSSSLLAQGKLKVIFRHSLNNNQIRNTDAYLRGTRLGSAVYIKDDFIFNRIPADKYAAKFSYTCCKPQEFVLKITDDHQTDRSVKRGINIHNN